MSVKIHYLVPLTKPLMGITHKAACQRAYSFATGKQLRGTEDVKDVTCEKCKRARPAIFGSV